MLFLRNFFFCSSKTLILVMPGKEKELLFSYAAARSHAFPEWRVFSFVVANINSVYRNYAGNLTKGRVDSSALFVCTALVIKNHSREEIVKNDMGARGAAFFFFFFLKIGCWHLWAMIKKVPLLDCVHSDVYPEACLWIRQLVPHPGLEEVPDVAEGHHGRGLHLQPT